MATQEQKLSKFIDAINKEAKERREQILRDAKEYSDRELEHAEQEVLTDAYELIQKETALMRNEIGRDLSKKTIDGRKELILKREQMTNQIFERAASGLKEFTQTPEYKGFLLKTAENGAKRLSGEITLYLRAEDMKFESAVSDKISCTVVTADDIQIGGLRLSDGQILIDQTLDSRLEEQREDFIKTSGLSL